MPAIGQGWLSRCGLLVWVVQRMKKRRLLIEIKELDATVFVADVSSPVCWIQGEAERVGGQQVGMKQNAVSVVPDNTGLVFRSGYSKIGFTYAVAEDYRVDCGTMICKCSEGCEWHRLAWIVR